MPLAIFVTALLILFGVYSAAPLFGVDELFPDLFRPYGPLSWAMVGLMVLGAAWWGVEKVQRSGLKRDPTKRDAMRAQLKDPKE
ncbi:hypothetical protein AIOL_000487 [Candidatus Rhodobacter oscarellae]|uniref:Uncharacterized protein n=1 Tax=Candidatus Rhodobacter oscarellae TaxID=1675527 RepID=A0A0J9EF78_9RHOB|nr:hypothetical protein [Candidatus Rhodobacter lobularis]KMW60334.1 hypothetical protein AIOL_000487 [Candidatus Rhodobacter lobularis]